MTPASGIRPRERRRPELVAAVILGVFVVVIEVALVASYLRGADTSQRFRSTASLITILSTVQREVLRLHVEVDRVDLAEAAWRENVEQQAAILRSQIRTAMAAARVHPDALEALTLIAAEADRISDSIAIATDRGPVGLRALDAPLIALEKQVKRLYDREEIEYFGTTADSLQSATASQFLLVVVAFVIAGLAVAVIVAFRRRINDEFAAAYRRLEEEMGERERAQRALRHLAFHDTLTGAPNRALFLERLGEVVGRGTGRVAVLFLDLDDFKTVNDTLGHGAGDQLLSATVGRVRTFLREADMVARMGGDEFAILLADVDDVELPERVAARIIDALRRPFALGEHVVEASVTIGIATGEVGEFESTDELLRNADLAMYAAKAAGKDGFQTFRMQLQDAARHRVEMRGALERALVENEYVLHYQPIVDLLDGRIAGVEALIRWQHPERGLVPPGEFIGAAEDSGLIVPIGRWALDTATTQVAAWIRDGQVAADVGLSVNLSPRQLRDPGLVDDVAYALRVSGLPPASLTFEMTETLLVDDIDAAAVTLERLKALGVLLAIDDFGTGYSSIGYLARLPIDSLKFDRSFVAAASDASHPRGRLARTILGLGRSVGLPSVAEGIEEARQVELVRELGCRYGQGYHFARPADAATIVGMLRGRVAVPPDAGRDGGGGRRGGRLPAIDLGSRRTTAA